MRKSLVLLKGGNKALTKAEKRKDFSKVSKACEEVKEDLATSSIVLGDFELERFARSQ